MRIINILLILSLVFSSCSPVFKYRNREELSEKLNWQASKNRLELVLQNGNHFKLRNIDIGSDSFRYQPENDSAFHTVSYNDMKYLRFKNYEKSVIWGSTTGLSLGIVQWNAIASSYEGGDEKLEVPLLITGMYIFLGILIGSVIGINEKVTPESIKKINNNYPELALQADRKGSVTQNGLMPKTVCSR